MTNNILDDEKAWQTNYRKYVSNLPIEELIKELKFVTHINDDFKSQYVNDFINAYEEVFEMKIRVEIICEVIKDKFNNLREKIKDVIVNPEHYNVGE